MSTVAEPILSPGTFDKRWVWGVRIAALICILLPWVAYAKSRMDPCGDFASFLFWISLAWTAIYLSILFKAAFGKLSKGGSSWAAKTGLSWFLIAALGAVLRVLDGGLTEGLLWTVLALANALLAVGAVKTYRSVEPGARFEFFDLILFEKLGVFLVCLFLGFVLTWFLMTGSVSYSALTGIRSRAVSAMASLAVIKSAEGEYSSKYNQGFSPTLTALGPPPGSAQPDASAAGLIDSSLASGTPPSYALASRTPPYTFTYSPGPRDSTGHITSYTVSARCNCADGRNNFFTDQSGVIRRTNENRPANAQDPPLQ